MTPTTASADPSALHIPAAEQQLVRAIGLWSAIAMVIGAVIGSGIFLTTGVMAQSLPSVTLVLAAWVAGGVLALAGGLTYAEMGAMFPRSGGTYVFLTEAYGPVWGFLFGWAGVLVILSGSLAAVAVGFAEYFSYFFPALSMRNVLFSVPGPLGAMPIRAGGLVAAASIAVLAAVNYVGVRAGNALQAWLTAIKVAALAAIPLLAIALGTAEPSFTPIVPDIARPAAAFGVAMIAVMWTYEGWYYVAFASGEIRRPERTVPLALMIGTLALTTIYVAVNVAYFYALPLSELRGTVRVAERAVGAMIGPMAGGIVAATVALSCFGCNAAGVIGVSRVCFAMAADGLFLRAAAAVHPKYHTPHVAIVLTCAWASILCLTGTYEQLFTYVTFASVLFFVLGGVAIFILRWTRPDLPRPYRAWGYPITPAIFVLGAGLLTLNTLVERPVESLSGLGLLALGLPLYWYWSRKNGS